MSDPGLRGKRREGSRREKDRSQLRDTVASVSLVAFNFTYLFLSLCLIFSFLAIIITTTIIFTITIFPVIIFFIFIIFNQST